MLDLCIYYDFASPFCWVALEAARLLGERNQLRIDWRPFEVIDYLPERGAMPQNPAFVRRGEETRAQKLATQYGLTMHLRDRLLNSKLALCAVEYAKTIAPEGALGSVVHRALFAAYYRDQRDISDLEVVVSVARDAGLENDLKDALRSGVLVPGVARSREAAHANGVIAVPTWIANGYGVVGVPPYAELARFIDIATAGKLATNFTTG